jgi:tRNA (guanine10-N2)-dimethyltransferase
LISGENPTLPTSEIKSILEAEGFQYNVLEELTQVLRVNTDPLCIEPIIFRSSMTKVCGIEIFNCKAKEEPILEKTKNADFSSYLDEKESFSVRIQRVRENLQRINSWTLEQRIGEIIFKKGSKTKVNLENPEKKFFGILTNDRFIFGLKIAENKPEEFVKRSPRKKIFFHPTAMPAKLARCMVNLTRPKKGDFILDPFCGTGSFLIEAGLIGCRVSGLDAKRKMTKGSLKNLTFYGIKTESIIVADARSPPFSKKSVDCIVSDPPYGTMSTTMGLLPRKLFESFLSNISEVIKKEGRICLAAPKSIQIHKIGKKLGYKHLESHFIYVHRSLTREIAVFEIK